MTWRLNISDNISLVITMNSDGTINYTVFPELEKDNVTCRLKDKYIFIGYKEDVIAFIDMRTNITNYIFWNIVINSNISAKITKDLLGNLKLSIIPESLERVFSLRQHGQDVYLCYYNDAYARINLNSPSIKYLRQPITSLEIRDTREVKTNQDDATVSNHFTFLEGKAKKSDVPIRTELHTHFIEMLSGENFLKVLLKYTDRVAFKGDKVLGKMDKGERLEHFPFIPISESNFGSIASQLSIDVDGQVPFSELEEVIGRRNNLVTLAARILAEKNGYQPKDADAVAYYRALIYIDLLTESLRDLSENGIEYVEFSYSNPKTIIKMQQDIIEHPNKYKGINFNFLFSLSRNVNSSSVVERNMNGFEQLVEKNLVKGFDLMGEESGLTYADCYDLGDSKSFVSIVNRALSILNNRDGMVLRLHAGENRNSINNPYYSLMIIKILQMHFGYSLPEIRIGHALHFNQTFNPQFRDAIVKLLQVLGMNEGLVDELSKLTYKDLLKDLGVVVEINATSNYTLSNIRNLNDLPYRWYVENEIPMVLATDGAGMYLTGPLQEKFVALLFGGEESLGRVQNTEESIISKR